MTDFVFPGRYHVVEFTDDSTALFVDDGTRKEIETACQNDHRWITVDDMYGVEFFILTDRVLMIHETTPESRLTYRLHNQAIDREKEQLGPWNPEE